MLWSDSKRPNSCETAARLNANTRPFSCESPARLNAKVRPNSMRICTADTINAVGVEFLSRLGIDFVWVGVESKRDIYTKTKGVDLKKTIAELRSYGIQVLGSGILFLEHHDKETIFEDIDYLIDLETDFVQFMELGPLPGTALYQEYEEAGKLRFDVPFEDWHGQDKIWFNHEHFSRDETAEYTKRSFQLDYRKQGPSLLRLADTSLRGYRTVSKHSSARIRGLTPRLKKRCLDLYPVFQSCRQMAENPKTIEMVDYLEAEYKKEFGPAPLITKLAAAVLCFFASWESLKIKNPRFMYQPPTICKKYRMKGRSVFEKVADYITHVLHGRKKALSSQCR